MLCLVYGVLCRVHNSQFVVCVLSAMQDVQCGVCSVRSVYNVQSAACAMFSVLCVEWRTLHSAHTTLRHYALNTEQ